MRSCTLHADLGAVAAYQDHSQLEVARVRKNLIGLSPDDKASLASAPEEQVQRMEHAVRANLAFLDKVSALMHAGGKPEHIPPQCPGSTKTVQTFLQTVVREWSQEGEQERRVCFERLLSALDNHFNAGKNADVACVRVLFPGTRLARLPFEAMRKGYTCEACEEGALNFFGSEFIRYNGAQLNANCIQPFVLNTCNRFKMDEHVRIIHFPEVDVSATGIPPVHFGVFIWLYDLASVRASFDAVITAFALDTSANIFRYVRTVAHVVRPGGLWANFGPLAYDADHDEAIVELSWEELRHAVSFFFDVREEDFVDALLAANAESMMQTQYTCVYFSAVRNSVPAAGIGEE